MNIPYTKIILTLVSGIISVIFYFGLTLDFSINESAPKTTFDIEEIKLFYDDSSKSTLLQNVKMSKEKNWILFFSPNCSYCKDQIILVNGLHDRLIESDIRLVLVSTLDQKTTELYLNENGIRITAQLYFASEDILFSKIDDFSYPYNVILDQDHNLIIKHKGVLGFNEIKKLL